MGRLSGRVRAARHRALFAAAGLVIVPGVARADDFNWKSSVTSGNWSVGTDWTDYEHPSTLGPPAANQNAYIGSGDTVTLNVANSEVENLDLGYLWNGTLQSVMAGTLSLLASSFELTVDDYLTMGNGSSIVDNNLDLVVDGYINMGVSGSGSSINVNGSLAQVSTQDVFTSNASTIILNNEASLQGSGTNPSVNIVGNSTLTIENQSSVYLSQGSLNVDTGSLATVANGSTVEIGQLEVGNSQAASLTIDATSGIGTGNIIVDNGGSLLVNGGQLDATQTFLLSGTNGSIYVGFLGSGALLNVNSGGEVNCFSVGVTNASTVSVNTQSQIKVEEGGSFQINGGSTLALQNSSQISDIGGNFEIGSQGSGGGTATVESGSRIITDEFELNSGASALVDGENTLISAATVVAGGNLTVQNGAIVSGTTGVVGGGATALVSGSLSTWNNGGSLAVGYGGLGSGTLVVQSGGLVSVGGNLNEDYGGSVDVTGSGSYGGASSLVVGGNLYTGYSATGTLTVQNGGYVSDLNGFVGYLPGSNGTALITDAGTIWNNTQGLYVNAGATLTIQNSATVTAAGGSAVSSSAIKIKSGGDLAVSGTFLNSAALSDGGIASFGSLTGTGTVADGGTLTFTPTVLGSLGNVVSGTGSLVMSGLGTLVVSSSNPSFAGTVSASDGVVRLNNSTSPLGTSAVNIGAAGTVDVNGFNLSVTKLTGSGAVDNLSAGGTTTLTVSNSANGTFYGSIRDTTGALNFTDAGTATLSLAGINTYAGTTTVNAGAALSLISTGALPVEGAVVNNGVLLVNASTVAGHVTGSGTAIVAPGVTFTTDFTQSNLVNNGTTYLDGQSSIGLVSGSGNLIVGPNAAVLLGAKSANSVGSLSIGSAASVDVNTGSIAINFPANADPISAIKAYLTSGYSGGTWTGTGIVSSVAAAQHGSPILSVGYADGNTDIGTAAGANQVLVAYTLAGDANLDGSVNFTDLGIVGQHLNTTGNDWAHGDFNYAANGVVNFTDLGIVGQNLNKLLTPAGSVSDETGGTTLWVDPPSTVNSAVQLPEPGMFGLAAAGIAGLLARRKRAAAR